SFAVKDGRILEVGKNDSILAKYESKHMIDAQGKAVFPGFIDAHCHFLHYGLGLTEVDLVGTKSFDDVLARVEEFAKRADGEWIVGRGWDQNDWDQKKFPERRKLDSLFPGRPVILTRIDGHAALVNGEALQRAGIHYMTEVSGGDVEVISVNPDDDPDLDPNARGEMKHMGYPSHRMTGILIDNAVDLVKAIIPKPSNDDLFYALLAAQKNCLAMGITTVDDAGLLKYEIDAIDTLHRRGTLKMRVYAMLSDSAPNYAAYTKPYKTERLNVCSYKFYADGALGSRGACLLAPYTDMPAKQGFLLSTQTHFEEKFVWALQHGFQCNAHCIGDSANRLVIALYQKYLRDVRDKRWRIEHAQVVSAADQLLLNTADNIIPSVQTTHATSDMYWAGERLGPERVKTAYAYADLLKQSKRLALGTDFPVENISPFYTFYAAVVRKDLKGWPAEGYQSENALTREQALRGMTSWAAWSNFEEKEKGSLEAGKFADFIILEEDMMKAPFEKLPAINVKATFINGEKVYGE
ncbi:MAG: Amidohydrolase 3, partial [Bacteroidetes bacterium]